MPLRNRSSHAEDPESTNGEPVGDETRAIQRAVDSTRTGTSRGRESMARLAPIVLPLIVTAVERVLDDPTRLEQLRQRLIGILARRVNPKLAGTVVDNGIKLARAAVERQRRSQR